MEDIDLNYMKRYQIKLCELRNAVIHLNIEKYIQNKVIEKSNNNCIYFY